jgi:hypothetical protein
VLDARSLAFAMANRWQEGVRAVRSPALLAWLDRALADQPLTERIEEILASDTKSGDVEGDVLLARALAVLDPQGPLWWRGLALMPDGLGTLLAEAHAAPTPANERQRRRSPAMRRSISTAPA